MVNDSGSEQVNNELLQDDKMEKIDDSSNIEQIKRKYKDLYGIDVEVEYNEENNVYLIETKNDEIIFATDSLDKELDRLKNIEENSQKSGRGGYLPSPPSIGERRQERALDAEEVQIFTFFSSMISVIGELDAMASMPLSCNTSYADCLSGELRTYYDGLGDNTKAALKALANSISGTSGATNKSLILYDNTSKEDLKDLKDLINTIYDESDMEVLYNNFMNQDIGDTPMSYDEYAYIFDNMGELFDGSYQDILEKFKSNLALGYQDFLRNTIPATLDNIVENTYLRISEEDIGSKAYLEGLDKYKNSFALKVLGDFDLNSVGTEDSNIPAYLWTNDTSDYDKALLVLSYNNDNFSNSYQDNFINVLKDSAEDNNLNADYIENHSHLINKSFNILEKTNNFYLKDFDKEYGNLGPQEKLKKIIKEYDELLNDDSDIGISKDVLYRNMSASAGNESGEAWEKTLKDFGYLDKIEGKYDTDVLYKETFTNEFIGKIIENEGQDKVYQVLRSYYRNYGLDEYEVEYKLNSIFREMDPYLINTVMNYNINVNLRNNLGITYNQLVQDKITLDASKAQFKLGLLENLDTSDITDADIIDAKKLLGADAAYLTDWQIKGYYKIYKTDKERAKKLLDDTLYNTIMDGRGYARAEGVYNVMTGEKQKELLNQMIHNEIINDIWGKTSGFMYTGLQGFTDGVVGSLRTVADLFVADGKMDENDYYLMHLQNMLSAGGFHNESLKLLYNASSSVGNMAPAMALSAFVSPLAMSAWIFASTVGSEREKTLRSGEGESVASVFNAVAKGLLAVGTEKFLGAFKGYGGKADDLLGIFKMDNTFIQKLMGTTFGKKFALGLSNSVNETIQELVENAGGYGIDFLTGKNIDCQNIPQETWETIYMTMLTTPFINKMGEGFRNNKHSLINKMNTYNFNGFNVEYSQAELLKFTDANGNVDQQGFMAYLMEHNRIKNIDVAQCESHGKKLLGLIGKTNGNLNQQDTIESIPEINVNNSNDFYTSYGSVDQSSLQFISNEKKAQLIEFAQNKYGLSKKEAEIVIRSINQKHGVCKTADRCNAIYALYGFDNELFMKDFGYSMVDSNGKLNDSQLLLDLYIFSNAKADGTGLVVKNGDKSYSLNKKYITGLVNKQVNTDNQTYKYNLHDFLGNLDNCSLDLDFVVSLSDKSPLIYITGERPNGLSVDDVKRSISAGWERSSGPVNKYEHFSLGLQKGIEYYDNGKKKILEDNHEVSISEFYEDGVLCRSWGYPIYVPYEFLIGKGDFGGCKFCISYFSNNK